MNQKHINQKILDLVESKNLSQKKYLEDLCKKCNPNQKNIAGNSIMILLCRNNYHWKFSHQLLFQMLKKADLNLKDRLKNSLIDYLIQNNYTQKIGLKKGQITYLIEKYTSQYKINLKNLVHSIILNNKVQYLLLSNSFIEFYWKKLNEDQQNDIFKNLIIEYIKNEKKYLREEINWLIYDIKISISPQTKEWIKINNYVEILKIIEKKENYVDLEKNLNNINTKIKFLKI